MALRGAPAFGQQIDGDFGLVLGASLVVVADQAVKRHGRGRAGVDDGVCGLGPGQHGVGQFPAHRRGGFQGRAARHVHYDREFALVVKGQHLDQHGLGRKQGTGPQKQDAHHCEKSPAPQRALEQPVHEEAVEPRAGIVGYDGMRFGVGLEGPFGRPGGDEEGDGHGQQHGHRRADGHGPHVRSHQPADVGHGRDGRDDREGGQHQRRAHLAHGLDNDPRQGFSLGPGQGQVAHDVFDVHDGVVHQDADAENQGEKRHPVERVAHEPVGGQRDGQGHRHGHHDHEAGAKAQKQRHHAADGDRGQNEVQQQFVHLVAGGFAVIAGDRDVEIGRQRRAAQGLDARQRLGGDARGVFPGPLGHGERHGRLGRAGLGRIPAGHEQDVVVGLIEAVGHGGHVGQIDRPAVSHADHGPGQLLVAAEKIVQPHGHGLPGPKGLAQGPGGVLQAQGVEDVHGVQALGAQPVGVGLHHDGPPASAGHGRLAHAFDAAHVLVDGVGHQAQLPRIVGPAPQGHRQHRHVVNGPGF